MIDTVEKRCKQHLVTIMRLSASLVVGKKLFLKFLQSNRACATYPFSQLLKNFRSLLLCGLYFCVTLVAKTLKLKAN